MNFGAAEMPYVTPMRSMPSDLSHELRTPLAVIRMQAQLLLRSARRGAFAGEADERDRLVLGLQRIDDAVTKLSTVLDRVATEAADDRYAQARLGDPPDAPEIH